MKIILGSFFFAARLVVARGAAETAGDADALLAADLAGAEVFVTVFAAAGPDEGPRLSRKAMSEPPGEGASWEGAPNRPVAGCG